jgi:Fe-S-cluster containining protein
LHGPDLELIKTGKIPLSALITLRKGELAHNPVSGRLTAIKAELVKLKGTGKEWNCCYYDSNENSCTIYDHRPQACRVLKCWEPEEILSMVEKDTLTRLDILDEDNAIRNLIREHDRLYPCPDMEELVSMIPDVDDTVKRKLQRLVNEDLRFRTRVVKEFELKLSEELFYFGRPVFQLLQPLGVRVTESAVGVELHWGK